MNRRNDASPLLHLAVGLLLLATLFGLAAPASWAAPGDGQPQETQPTATAPNPNPTFVPLPTTIPVRLTPTPGGPGLGVPSPTPVPTDVPSQPTDEPVEPTIAATQPSAATPPVSPPPIANVTPPPGDGLDPSQYGKVTLNVRICPPTFYGNGALNSAFPQLCTIAPYRAWVGALPLNSGSRNLNIVDNGASKSWNLPPGKVEILASQAGGFTFVRTVCQASGVSGVFDAQPGGWAGQKTIDLAAGQQVRCTFFMSTTPVATGTINLTLHECTTAPQQDTQASFEKTCTTPMDGVRIWQDDRADEPSEKESNWTGYTGDAGSGMVSFPTTPAGTYQVMAVLIPFGQDPAGAMVVGYCTGQPKVTLPAESGWMTVNLPPGGTVTCDIYFSRGRG